MQDLTPIHLRATTAADLHFVLELEHRPDNRDFIGRWTRDEHLATMSREDRQHLVIAAPAGQPLGYVISYDVRRAGYGIYVKRIAVNERSRGIGREALTQFAARVWADGAPFVCLAVRPQNERAKRCYRAVGFAEWNLDAASLADFLAAVDPPAANCLIMRLLPG